MTHTISISISTGVLQGQAGVIHRCRKYVVDFVLHLLDTATGKWRLEVEEIWRIDRTTRKGVRVARHSTRATLMLLLFHTIRNDPATSCIAIQDLVGIKEGAP